MVPGILGDEPRAVKEDRAGGEQKSASFQGGPSGRATRPTSRRISRARSSTASQRPAATQAGSKSEVTRPTANAPASRYAAALPRSTPLVGTILRKGIGARIALSAAGPPASAGKIF